MTIKEYLNKKEDLSSLKNKNIFITGGNSGIGFKVARISLLYGANVFLLCRNLEKAKNAKEQLLKEFKNSKIELIQLDLADLKSIKNCSLEIMKYDVDIFVNNAGVFRLPKSKTIDGFEVIMGTNFIGTLYLNDLLTPYFKSLNHEIKLILESSITSKLFRFNFNDFFMDKHYNKMMIYGKSKVGINSIYFTYIKENQNTNIKYSLVHPGATYTPLITKGYKNKLFEKIASGFMKIFFHTPEKAALSLLEGIMSKENNSSYGPRGLFALSGFPHKWKVNEPKDYLKAINLARDLIKEKETNNE